MKRVTRAPALPQTNDVPNHALACTGGSVPSLKVAR